LKSIFIPVIPGVGKTTLVQKMAGRFAARSHPT